MARHPSLLFLRRRVSSLDSTNFCWWGEIKESFPLKRSSYKLSIINLLLICDKGGNYILGSGWSQLPISISIIFYLDDVNSLTHRSISQHFLIKNRSLFTRLTHYWPSILTNNSTHQLEIQISYWQRSWPRTANNSPLAYSSWSCQCSGMWSYRLLGSTAASSGRWRLSPLQSLGGTIPTKTEIFEFW